MATYSAPVDVAITVTLTGDAVELVRAVTNVDSSSMPSTAFWTLGWPFKEAEVPTGNICTATLGGTIIPVQACAISRHNDGSMKWAQLLFDFSGVALTAAASKDIVLTSVAGSWSSTSARSNSDWTALVDTVELTNLTTTGTSATDMDKAGTWIAAFDAGATNTIETYGATSVGLWVSIYANFVNTGTTHAYLRARMEYLVCEKADTSLGPIAARGPFIDNTRCFKLTAASASDPSQFTYDFNWKRNGVSQRSTTAVPHVGMTFAQFCRNDGQWDWTANEPIITVTQDYRLTRKTKKIPPFLDSIQGNYSTAAEWAVTCNTTTGVFTMTATNGTIFEALNSPPLWTAVSFTTTGSLWSGGTANTTYWANYLSPTTFNLYDTLAHAQSAGSTGKQATGGGTVSNTLVRSDVGPLSSACIQQNFQEAGIRDDIGPTTEWGAAYHVGNTQAHQRRARAIAYCMYSISYHALETTLIPSLMDAGGTPAGMTSRSTSFFRGPIGVGGGASLYSSDIAGNAGPSGGANGWDRQAYDSSHFPNPAYMVWLMEGGSILRDELFFLGGRAVGSANYPSQRNISVNGGTTRYANVIVTDEQRTGCWAMRDIVYARMAAADGSTMASYWDNVVGSSFNAWNDYSNYLGTNFKNTGIWINYQENDYPPSTSRTLHIPGWSITYQTSYWGVMVSFAAMLHGDNATYGTLIGTMADRLGGYLAYMYNTGCGYFATSYEQGVSTSAWGAASPGAFVSSNAQIGLTDTSSGILFNYATNGTITVTNDAGGSPPTLEYTIAVGDTFRPTNYHVFLFSQVPNPPTPLAIGTNYTILSVNTGANTFTLDNGSGGTQTFGSNVTGSAGWFLPTGQACPPTGSVQDFTSPVGDLANQVAAAALGAVRGVSGGSAAYAACSGRFSGSYNAQCQWGLQGTV